MSFRYHGVSRHHDRHQIECWTAGLVRMCRELTGLRLVPSRLRLVHQRGEDQGAELSKFFGKAIEFGAPVDDVLFPRSAADTRILSADPYLNRLLLSHCEEALAHRKRAGSFRHEVVNALAPLLPHGDATAGAVARQLAVSQRTLARRLSEGVTFSDLLDELRSDLAARYLAEKDADLADRLAARLPRAERLLACVQALDRESTPRYPCRPSKPQERIAPRRVFTSALIGSAARRIALA